jgi:arylsulfatase A-like enzyme
MDRAFGKLRKAIADLRIRDNTLLWYTSDNGGSVEASTGGRGKKGMIYEGGLRVPAMIEWPKGIAKPRVTSVPCNSSDIYPTLLALTGIPVPHRRPLDGISLVPLLKDAMDRRPRPMGFWRYPARGRVIHSHKVLARLREAQRQGRDVGDASYLDLDAGTIKKTYPENSFPGHAAWLEWPWKLHRIQDKKTGIRLELYHLETDPMEATDLAGQQEERVKSMRRQLEEWQASTIRSLNGKDYG